MKTNSREILVYYNPDSSSGKKTLAHAKSRSAHVRAYSYSNNPSTTTSWDMILESLDMDPKDLLDKSHPEYQAKIRGKEFDKHGWLEVLSNNAHLIKAPIVIKGSRAILCVNPTDVLRL